MTRFESATQRIQSCKAVLRQARRDQEPPLLYPPALPLLAAGPDRLPTVRANFLDTDEQLVLQHRLAAKRVWKLRAQSGKHDRRAADGPPTTLSYAQPEKAVQAMAWGNQAARG